MKNLLFFIVLFCTSCVADYIDVIDVGAAIIQNPVEEPLDCTIVRNDTISGVVLDHHTNTPLQGVKVSLFDLAIDNERYPTVYTDINGRFEHISSGCARNDDFLGITSAHHEDYDRSAVVEQKDQLNTKIKMFHMVDLTLILVEEDTTTIDWMAFKYQYNIDNNQISWGMSTNINIGTSTVIRAPLGIDFQLGYDKIRENISLETYNFTKADTLYIDYQ